MSARRWLLIPLVVLLAAPSVLSAQSSVEARVQKLEEMIRVLEHKVADLESQLREQKTDAPVPAGKVTWRKLQKGMSESDVETLLGSPTKVDVFSTFTI